jgi:hypothetical protein
MLDRQTAWQRLTARLWCASTGSAGASLGPLDAADAIAVDCCVNAACPDAQIPNRRATGDRRRLDSRRRWRQFTGEEVIAGPAVEHIITRTASHEVVPGASQQFIPAETPDDRVRPVATVADIIAEG